jgi:anti-sigma-K factor RskA
MEPMENTGGRDSVSQSQASNVDQVKQGRLDALWLEYRDACPDPEPTANFMPQMWQRIEARRNSAVSGLLRRWAEVCLVATLALAALLVGVVIPRYQAQDYQAYVDVLAADDSASDAAVMPVAELEPVSLAH